MTSYTELTDTLGQFVHRFFNGHDPDGHFKEHIEKNQISKTILGLVTTSVWVSTIVARLGAELASREEIKTFFTNDIFVLQYISLSVAGFYQLPIHIFALLSFFSLWATYNNYILVMHSGAVNWSVKGVAAIGIALLLAVFVLGFVFPFSMITMILILAAYLCAIEVAFSLRNSIKVRSRLYQGEERPEIAMRLTSQWLFVNFIVASALSIMTLLVPSTKDILQTQASAGFDRALMTIVILQSLVYMLAFLVVLVSALRSEVYLDYTKYAQEIRAFNEKISSSLTPPKSDSSPPPPTFVPRSVATLIAIVASILSSARIFSASLGALLIFFNTHSHSYAVASLLFLLFSFLFNDLADFQSGRDLVGHPSRALPSGALSPRVAQAFCFVILAAGVLTAYLAAEPFGNMFTLLYLFSVIYSIGLKRLFPLVATPAWCVALTILVLWPFGFNLVHYALVFSYLYSRELLLDLRDVHADNQFSIIRSLPSLMGRSVHWLIGGLFVLAGFIGWSAGYHLIAVSSFAMLAVYVYALRALQDQNKFSVRIASIMRVFVLEIFLL